MSNKKIYFFCCERQIWGRRSYNNQENIGIKIKNFSEVDIEAFLAKDLQYKFEKLDEDDVQELIGFIPSASSTLIEYGTLGEVVDYLMKTELPKKIKNE